jgi:hypothetical protein
LRHALLARHGDGAEAAFLDPREAGGEAVAAELHHAGGDVGNRRRAAATGDVHGVMPAMWFRYSPAECCGLPMPEAE